MLDFERNQFTFVLCLTTRGPHNNLFGIVFDWDLHSSTTLIDFFMAQHEFQWSISLSLIKLMDTNFVLLYLLSLEGCKLNV